MNRKLGFLIFILLAVSCLITSLSMAEVITWDCEADGPWQYLLSGDDTARIVGYTDPDAAGTLEIPDKVNGHPVTAVGGLGRMINITKVLIPNTVTRIEAMAFIDDRLLEGPELPSSLVSIGYCAFQDCAALKSIEIPGSVAYIGHSAFCNSGLETIMFIPGEKLMIEHNPFVNTQVEHYAVPEDHPNLASYQGVLFDKAEKKLISYPSAATAESYTIPRGIKNIGESAFAGAKLTRVIFPETVIKIEDSAFYDAALTEAVLPDSLEAIGSWAFFCNQLESIQLGCGLIEIDGHAFDCSSLSRIDIPENVRIIGGGVFNSCSLLVEINVSDRNPYFFVQNHCLIEKCSQRIIAFPLGKAVGTLEIPDGILMIGEDAFCCAMISEIVLPDSVRMIDCCAFCNMPYLKSIRLSSNLMVIGSGCFAGSYRLNHLTIPRSVGRIEDGALPDIDGLDLYIEKGSYAETFCLRENMPYTCIPADQETGDPRPSVPVLGFSDLPADTVRRDVSGYLDALRSGKELPSAGQPAEFPGTLNVREITEFGKALFDSRASAASCPECMEGMWMISLAYKTEEITDGFVSYVKDERFFPGTVEQILQMDDGKKPFRICFARNGIFYDFYDETDDIVGFSVHVSDSSEEILKLSDLWNVETFSESCIIWDNDAPDDHYRARCVFNSSKIDPETLQEAVICYTASGRCLGEEGQE